MGQKVHPHGLRVGVIKDWDSKWYADKKDFSGYLVEDVKIREFVKKRLFLAGVPKIEIERKVNKVFINISAAKPGIVIGRGGSEIEKLRKELVDMVGKDVAINIIEVKTLTLTHSLLLKTLQLSLKREFLSDVQ